LHRPARGGQVVCLGLLLGLILGRRSVAARLLVRPGHGRPRTLILLVAAAPLVVMPG